MGLIKEAEADWRGLREGEMRGETELDSTGVEGSLLRRKEARYQSIKATRGSITMHATL